MGPAQTEIETLQTETVTAQNGREASRLAALYSLAILDTPPEPGYDAITRLAADYFEADLAIIAFADETRVWIKSHWGQAARELPRSTSVFDIVLAADGPVVIHDVRQHPDFQGKKLHLHSLNTVFLAAAPVRAHQRRKYGGHSHDPPPGGA